MRAAIYARFSSDLQRDKSIDDQIALCREVAARENMTVTATFSDRAISGSSAVNRPGFQAMMRAARAKQFDCLIAEDVDRISRDQADYHSARRDLDFLGIVIHTASGKVTRIDGALRALMGEMFIENLVLHVRRGMEGVVRSGRHAGGRAYGYGIVPGKPGELQIDAAEAAIVREIFAAYAAGRTPRDIAGELTRRGVRPPRGAKWNASTINGNMARSGGILLNELYVGRIVWNKVRMVKDPATGKRLSRPNPKDQHRSADAPHLRIVDDATFAAAQLRKVREQANPSPRQARRPRIFSGLLRCADCGGGLSSIGKRGSVERVQCSNFKENGTCENGRRIKRADVERLALAALKQELTAPDLLAEYVKTYNAERARLRKTTVNKRASLERRLGEVRREMNRMIDAIAKEGVPAAPLAPRIKALEAEQSDIEAKLALTGKPEPLRLHPAALDRYRADVARLEEMDATDATGAPDDLHDSIRRLITEVVVTAPRGTTRLEIEVKGRLAELLQVSRFADRSGGGDSVVAGEGLARSPLTGLPEFRVFARRA